MRFVRSFERRSLCPVTGPFRMTVVLGGAGESAGGQCGHHTFPALNCVVSGGGKTLKCK